VNAERYTELLKKTDLVEKSGVGIPEAVYRNNSGSNYHIYNQFVLRVPRRDALRDFLKGKGVATEVYYPVPFHLQECFSSLGLKEGSFPESERAARETVALPIYPGMTAEQQVYVVDQLAAFYK
jgi:dTDP-4-amino-4,6-dideoxygalactose transaminase